MKIEPFNQPPSQLGNQYDDDRVLKSYLKRVLPPDALADVEPFLRQGTTTWFFARMFSILK